jgi:hypothetical protein
MEDDMEKKQTVTGPDFKPVDLRIAVSLLREGKLESCCNYDISGRTGNVLLVLPPMTHVQDMPR